MFASPTTNDDAGGPRVNPPGAEQSGQQTTGVEIDLISVDIFGAHVATMQLEIRLRKGSLHFLLPSQEIAQWLASTNMNWRGESHRKEIRSSARRK